MTIDQVTAAEKLLRTFHRLGVMPPYIVTVEMRPSAAYVSDTSDIRHEVNEKIFLVVVRILGTGEFYRIRIEEE